MKTKQNAYIFKGLHTRLQKNRKGSAYWFLYVLIFGLIIALLFIIFNQILNIYLYPTTEYLTGGDTTEPDKWLGYWAMMPYIIVIVLLAFMYFKFTQQNG